MIDRAQLALLSLAFTAGMFLGGLVWQLTIPQREMRHVYLHTTVCEYVIDERYWQPGRHDPAMPPP